MSENISLIIAFILVLILFFISNKLKLRTKLTELFYKWFKNMPSSLLHILAFIVNFAVIVTVGVANSIIGELWFTITVFPLAIAFVLNVTTSLIATARVIKYKSTQITPKAKVKPNRAKKK
ncbi:MAG: hypothetical protein ACRC6T_13660 [Sarcina sp.]